MRLLYNLLGYEAELAREKGKEVDYRSRLSWPFLAREVHALNLRYLQ
jgi:dual specificity MAP kinase phosphatase